MGPFCVCGLGGYCQANGMKGPARIFSPPTQGSCMSCANTKTAFLLFDFPNVRTAVDRLVELDCLLTVFCGASI